MSANDLPRTLSTHVSDADILREAPPFIAAVPALATPAELDLRRYELSETLGRGGMGEVYRCGDPALGRDLAIKVMKAELRTYPNIERRFLREARITASLQHPGIVPIHNLGRLADGRLHYTMRLVRGQTFADLLKEDAGKAERLPELLTIFEKICQAVAYAHSKRVIHRDLKPANVMVGRFGEVQVMDWGLAKLMTADERDGVSAPHEEAERGTRIHTEGAETPADLTRMGREMGTPAYMPPEQALGEWDTVDERADVFALGAILCDILTGQPPYAGRDGEEALRKARRGEWSEASARLDQCGADKSLTALCRACLTAEREARPRNAEDVARRVAAYQAEVQERLRRAELQRAAAEVRVAEERKRRRLTAVLASTVLLAILAGGSAFFVVQRQKQARQEQTARLVQQALGQATALRDQAEAAPVDDAAQRERAEALWRDALAAADRAEQALADGEADADISRQTTELLAELRQQAAEADKDRLMLQRLEQAHDLLMQLQESDYARTRRIEEFVIGLAAVPAYTAAFRDYGIDVETLSPADAAQRIRQRRIRLPLTVALDVWSFLAPEAAGERLLDISRAADPDPLRDRVRGAIAGKDRSALKALAECDEVLDLPVLTLILLAYVVHEQGLLTEGVELLKRARSRHPNNFWIYSALGLHLRTANPPDYEEAARCFAAASALRPTSATAWQNLGVVLGIQGRLDDAISVLRESVRIQPDSLLGYQLISEALMEKSQLDQALAVLQEPLRRHPDSPMLRTARGRILHLQGKNDEAIATFRQVLSRHPEWVYARIYLAAVLGEEVSPREAHEQLDQAQRSHPELYLVYEMRGQILRSHGDLDGALTAYSKAVELAPGIVSLWSCLGGVLAAKGQKETALRMLRKAIHMTPENAGLHVYLAASLHHMGRINEAEAEHELAIQLNSRCALAYRGLGQLQLAQKKYKDAEQSFRQALSLLPRDAWCHVFLAMSLRYQNNYPAAVSALTEAIRLKPDEGAFHDQLGQLSYDQEHYAEAIPHYQKAIRLKKAKYGESHSYTLFSIASLGMVYRDAKQLAEAVPLLETALERGRKCPGGLPASLAGVPSTLAQTYDEAGVFAKAEPIYRDVLKQTQKQFGSNDLRTAGVQIQLAGNLLKQKKFIEAEPLLRQCLHVREAKQADDWTTFNTRSLLGEALVGQNNYAEAEPLLLQGYQGMMQRQGKIPQSVRALRLREAMERLVHLYEATGQKDKAVPWRKQLEETKTAQQKPNP